MTVAQVTEATWGKEVLESDKPTLVKFYADWCAPCRMMDPIVEKVAAGHEADFTAVKVNVDENQNLSAAFNITSIPAILLLDKGEVKARIVGSRTQPMLERELTAALA